MSGEHPPDRDRWQRIEQIYWQASAREGAARAAVLDEACAGAPALRHAVESLLAREADASGFLETNALDVAAHLLTHQADADLVGRRIGAYLVESWLGSGGMGDVYRARDEHLQRDVALKILPGVFAPDADRLARFKKEAQVLASLNHPNIAAIHGFEESEGVQALVLELVDGLTLADRIAQGPIPIEDAAPIARQIAEGLEAAHERGIVHRDLKPTNIALRPDGTVKLLDFGLATALQPEAIRGGNETTSSEARSAPSEGLIVGTLAYASPEQAKGRPTDKRTDVWAFGAVLYEMLSGRPAFTGDSASDTIAMVLQGDIDWGALPYSTPEPVRRLISRCLNRDARRRLRDIGEARIALDDASATTTDPVGHPATFATTHSWPRAIAVGLAAIATLALGAAFAWYVKPGPTVTTARFELTLPEGQVFSRGIGRHAMAISRDGTQIVYSSVPGGLYLRQISELEPKAIQGTEGLGRVSEPAFSPDGRSVAFYADGAIKSIPTTGGSPVTLAAIDAPYGMSWGTDGITFGQGHNGIMRVSATGGTPDVLVRVSEGEEAHGPQMLPDGQHLLFTIATGTSVDRWNKSRIVLQSLKSGERVTLIDGGSDARYVSTGHIVYALSGILYAVAFDLQQLKARGDPKPIVEGVSRATGSQTGAAHFSVSGTGSLLYIPGPVAATDGRGETTQLGLIDRTGAVTRLPIPPGEYQTPRVSPDGTRIAFGTDDGREAIVWIVDLSTGARKRRLTYGGNNRFAIWSHDGTRVAFQSDREGDRAVFWQPADGSGKAQRLTRPAEGASHVPESWSPTAEMFLYSVTKGSSSTLWTGAVQDRNVTPFDNVRSEKNIGAVFSPDGRWVAYASAEQGRQSIYVQPYPPTGARYQLDVDGEEIPSHPVWSPDGKELFYNPRPRGFGVVSVKTAPTFAFGTSGALPRPFQLTPPEQQRAYDITPGGLFIARVPVNPGQYGHPDTEMRVVLNWFEELRTRVPATK